MISPDLSKQDTLDCHQKSTMLTDVESDMASLYVLYSTNPNEASDTSSQVSPAEQARGARQGDGESEVGNEDEGDEEGDRCDE